MEHSVAQQNIFVYYMQAYFATKFHQFKFPKCIFEKAVQCYRQQSLAKRNVLE